MITAEEFLINNSVVGMTDLMSPILIKFAKEAIKADRINLLNYAQAKEKHSDYGTGEIWVDEKSIINAPNINIL